MTPCAKAKCSPRSKWRTQALLATKRSRPCSKRFSRQHWRWKKSRPAAGLLFFQRQCCLENLFEQGLDRFVAKRACVRHFERGEHFAFAHGVINLAAQRRLNLANFGGKAGPLVEQF